ncbi:4Fe-4S binding protein [Amaricoccus macauensis]|uniref:4Fe-4S binding protein n=1 Tax=Amaricoccus macauensis TaxID=57001 RepID=UPI003C7BD9C5
MTAAARLPLAVCLMLALIASQAFALEREDLAPFVVPPFSIGEPVNDEGVWELLNSGGAMSGYVFETEPLAPLPGFSGAPINVMVMLDLDGRFMDVKLISHNEPIFVSGLGEAPFRKFFEQYRGLSITSSIVVGTPYGSASSADALVYLDGVTKATASVRIAHESILAATLQVARDKMQGVQTGPPARPDPDHDEPLDWEALVAEGLVTQLAVTNAEVDAAFAGTIWADDDPEASDYPEETYLDLRVADLGPPAIARALLSESSYDELQAFLAISGSDEPILVIEAGRHGLVSPDFVRNTAPDWVTMEQDGLPVALRDADLLVELSEDVPERLHDGTAMIFRTDRRLGFDPSREWTMGIKAVREHGMFRPEIGSVTLELAHQTDARFFLREEVAKPAPPWLDALRNRQTDIAVLGAGLVLLGGVQLMGMNRLAGTRWFPQIRLAILAVVLVFVGWHGQGQLSIVTPLATLRTAIEGGSFAFLLYDPFSTLLWVFVLVSFVLWGRGFFCGWLCPFGALQEFADRIGRWLRLPVIEPSPLWDARLRKLKYVILAALVAVALVAPAALDKAVEVEPFKTAITVHFVREWFYVLYAAFWLVLGLVLFKGFCRYVCPLGAFMALGGLLRGRDWIARRTECGSPCQLCKVRCRYGAIEPSGKIDYSECFQCLDCVTIHDDPKQCVPVVLKKRGRRAPVAARASAAKAPDGGPAPLPG